MKIKIIFIESNNDFSKKEKERISKIISKVFSMSSRLLQIDTPVNFTLYRFGKSNGGFTQAKDWIMITIPKGKIDYTDLEGMLYHEIHHISRGYSGYLEKGDHFLLNSLFSEGLAVLFEEENQSSLRRTINTKYTKLFIKKWLSKAKKEFYTTKYSYDSWFLGENMPKRLGYKLGKYLATEVVNNYPKLTHKELARKSAKELLKMSRVR